MKKAIIAAVFMVLGITVFSSCALMKGETTGEYIDDSTTTTQVNGIIVKDPDARYFKIEVTTTQGNVVLQGLVNNRDTEARLVANIMKIKGVKSVDSFLQVEVKP